MAPEGTKMIFGTKQLSSLSRANGRLGRFTFEYLAHKAQVLTIKQQSLAKDSFSFSCGSLQHSVLSSPQVKFVFNKNTGHVFAHAGHERRVLVLLMNMNFKSSKSSRTNM